MYYINSKIEKLNQAFIKGNIIDSNELNIDFQDVVATNCDSEQCVTKKMPKYKAVTSKVDGPNDISLLSNDNIDAVQTCYMNIFKDYFAYTFNMRNFKEMRFDHGIIHEPDTLATIKMADILNAPQKPIERFGTLCSGPYKMCGCVINTDNYTGSGKHWMALFVDFRTPNISVEFFNSSGNNPSYEYNEWMTDTCDDLKKLFPDSKVSKVVVNKFEHQKSATECGLYSLFYIWCRLTDIPYEYISTHRITDGIMFAFRVLLFNDEKFISKYIDHLFNDEEFMDKVERFLCTPAGAKVKEYKTKNKLKFCNRPLRFMILDTIGDIKEFEPYTRFQFKRYKELVKVKWA